MTAPIDKQLNKDAQRTFNILIVVIVISVLVGLLIGLALT